MNIAELKKLKKEAGKEITESKQDKNEAKNEVKSEAKNEVKSKIEVESKPVESVKKVDVPFNKENKESAGLSESERDELARLRAEKELGLSLKVSQKGAVSLYGLGRFPVTLYKNQWEKLLKFSDSIEEFIANME